MNLAQRTNYPFSRWSFGGIYGKTWKYFSAMKEEKRTDSGGEGDGAETRVGDGV